MNRSASRPGLLALLGYWLLALLSLALLAPSALAVVNDITSFRSCNANASGLFVHSCGKQSLNSGDLLLGLVFIGCLAIALSLFTHAIRLTRRPA